MKVGAGTAGKMALHGGDRVETEGPRHLQGCGAAPRCGTRSTDHPVLLLLPCPARACCRHRHSAEEGNRAGPRSWLRSINYT